MDGGRRNCFYAGYAQMKIWRGSNFCSPSFATSLQNRMILCMLSSGKETNAKKGAVSNMLTNEIVLSVFADYLDRDPDYEVVHTSRGYTVMGWDNRRKDWNTVVYCDTPEDLRDALLDAYANLREMELTDGERDLTEKEEAMLCAECDDLTKKCDKEAAICSS